MKEVERKLRCEGSDDGVAYILGNVVEDCHEI